MEKICGDSPGGNSKGGGVISVVSRRIFVPLKRYGHPIIEPAFFKTRFLKILLTGSPTMVRAL